MQCFGGSPPKVRTPSPTPEPTPRTPTPPRPVVVKVKTPSPSPPRERTPSSSSTEPPTPVKKKEIHCEECMVFKRQEIDFELEALKRETKFVAVDLEKIWSCDHPDAKFEAAIKGAIDDIADYPELEGWAVLTELLIQSK